MGQGLVFKVGLMHIQEDLLAATFASIPNILFDTTATVHENLKMQLYVVQ